MFVQGLCRASYRVCYEMLVVVPRGDSFGWICPCRSFIIVNNIIPVFVALVLFHVFDVLFRNLGTERD